VNDEVSVAELLEREGWAEADPAPKGRLQVVAVMLAVVLGCGLAALLVHFGSQTPQADTPSVFDLPHGPAGGLAGGGVPASPHETDVTGTDTHVVVTNEAAPGNSANAIPWHTRHRTTDTQTVTVTGSSTTSSSATRSETTATTTNSSQPAGGGGKPTSSTTNSPPPPTPSRCLLFLCL
jgi:hypothetical protein